MSVSPRPRGVSLVLALLVALGCVLPAAQAEDAGQVPEAMRLRSIRQLGKTLRKKTRSPRRTRYRDEILEILDSLEVFGGWEAGKAALRGVAYVETEPVDDGEAAANVVRDRIFDIVDTEHAPDLVAPLAALLDDKDYRRDVDLRLRIARSLGIVLDPAAIAPLTSLIRTDEDAKVVAAAAESLTVYAAGPLPARKEAVKQLVATYTTTYNLMLSIKPDQKVLASVMKKRYAIYATPLRRALQALTRAQLTRPQEWREWWNEHKKRTDW